MPPRRLAAVLLAVLTAVPAISQEDLAITDATIPATQGLARSAAGYLDVANPGTAPDRLIGVESGFPRTALHLTQITDGVATMTPQDGAEVPAGGTLSLAPGGLHVMFMGLDAPLAPGDSVDATLIFETAGRVPVTFRVIPRPGSQGHGAGAAGGMDHSGHAPPVLPADQ